jgi:hypothetical protein
MVARKNAVATDLSDFISGQIKAMQKEGVAVPKEWADWAKTGTFNLDQTPVDVLKDRMAELDAEFGAKADTGIFKRPEFSRVDHMISSGYGSGVSGANAAAKASAQVAGAGHVAGRGYGYEAIRPTLRQTPAGAAAADKWERANEWMVLHGLFDTSTAWTNSPEHIKDLRAFFNPDTGLIRLIRITSGYGTAQASYEGYARDGFRNLLSFGIGSGRGVGGHGLQIYADVKPSQFFSAPFSGFATYENEVAVMDLTIDQVVAMSNKGIGGGAAGIMAYNGPVVHK